VYLCTHVEVIQRGFIILFLNYLKVMAKKNAKKTNLVGKEKKETFTVTAREWSEEELIARFTQLGL
jgi:hypothetical protein